MNLKQAKQKRKAERENVTAAQKEISKEQKKEELQEGYKETVKKETKKGEIKMEEKIKNGIEQIRPFLQRDGGDIEFVEYTDDNIVKVRLLGHCQGCPHRQATINGMVAQVLQESYPEVAGVVAVD